jgi:hypothetical protein
MNYKIVEYTVISVTLENRGVFAKPIDELTFSKLVNDKIKEGFQPYGEFKTQVIQKGSIFGYKSKVVLSQAMVKYL